MSSDLEHEHSGDVESQAQQISVKCRAKRLIELINLLNDAQRSAVKRIGFGGLLELKIQNFPLSAVPIFLDCFHDGSYIFRAPNAKEFMPVHELFLTIQRNTVAFHSWYTEAVSKIRHLTSDDTVHDGFVPSQSTQDFWQSEELHRFCDRVESDAERLKQSASDAPNPLEVHMGSEKANGFDVVATQQLREVLDDLKTTPTPDGDEQVAGDNVPIMVDNHIACVCVNFDSRTADILDNESHNDPTSSEICRASKIIVSALSDYLECKGIGKGCEITSFPHRPIKFQWIRSSPNHEESGIFKMVHMLMYEGHPFVQEDLGSKVRRRYLVIQLAAALVLADMNNLRSRVMEDVTQWVLRKDSIMVTLKAKRKVVQILTKTRSSK